MKPIDKLLDIFVHLRTSPDGCAWTKAQTHATLIPSLLEEAYETAEIIDAEKTDEELRDELGDLLLQVAFHAQIAAERGAFTFDDVAQAICDKLVRRYPTIFGDEPNTLKTPEEIDRRWEEVKAEERKKKGTGGAEASVLDGVSHALPALVRAAKIKGQFKKAGWDWPDVNMQMEKIEEELGELRAEITAAQVDREKVAGEIGDLLFMITDCAVWQGVDAENALRQTLDRVELRFRHMERGVKALGKDIRTSTREERKALWDEAKRQEKQRKAG